MTRLGIILAVFALLIFIAWIPTGCSSSSSSTDDGATTVDDDDSDDDDQVDDDDDDGDWYDPGASAYDNCISFYDTLYDQCFNSPVDATQLADMCKRYEGWEDENGDNTCLVSAIDDFWGCLNEYVCDATDFTGFIQMVNDCNSAYETAAADCGSDDDDDDITDDDDDDDDDVTDDDDDTTDDDDDTVDDQWTFASELIDATGADGSIATDSNNKAHVCYNSADTLKYGTNASGSWSVSTIDNTGDTGLNCAIAIAPNGNIHISYVTSSSGKVRHAWKTTVWQTEDVASTNCTVGGCGPTDIEVTTGNSPRIAYVDVGNLDYKMYYATMAKGSWSTNYISAAGEVHREIVLKLDSSNKAFVKFYDHPARTLKYLTNKTGSWASHTVYAAAGNEYISGSSMDMDSSGDPHFSYYMYNTSTFESCVYYAEDTGAGFSQECADYHPADSQWTSIGLDDSDNAFISYQNFASTKTLYYVTNVSGTWDYDQINATNLTGWSNELAVDGAGRGHIIHDNTGNGSINYTHNPVVK